MNTAPTLQVILEFAVKKNGVVLKEWFDNPTRQKVCRIIFPATVKKVYQNAGSSPFIKEVINTFYPYVIEDRSSFHHAFLSSAQGNQVLFLESDLWKRDSCNNMELAKVGTYQSVRKDAQPWTFLTVQNVLVQM